MPPGPTFLPGATISGLVPRRALQRVCAAPRARRAPGAAYVQVLSATMAHGRVNGRAVRRRASIDALSRRHGRLDSISAPSIRRARTREIIAHNILRRGHMAVVIDGREDGAFARSMRKGRRRIHGGRRTTSKRRGVSRARRAAVFYTTGCRRRAGERMANHEQRPPRHDAASETPTTRRGSDTAPAAERVCLHRWVASAMRGFVIDSPTRCQPATSHAHLRPARPLSTSPPRAPSHSATKRSGTARLQSGPTSGNVSGDLATSRRTHTGGLRRARRVAPKTAPWSDVTLAPRRSEYCRPHRHCADSPVHRVDDAQPTPSTLSPAFRPSIPTPPPTTRLSIASTTPSRRPSPSGAPGPVNIDTAGLHPASARPFQAHLQRDV